MKSCNFFSAQLGEEVSRKSHKLQMRGAVPRAAMFWWYRISVSSLDCRSKGQGSTPCIIVLLFFAKDVVEPLFTESGVVKPHGIYARGGGYITFGSKRPPQHSVRSSNGEDTGFSSRQYGFDPRTDYIKSSEEMGLNFFRRVFKTLKVDVTFRNLTVRINSKGDLNVTP